MYVLEFLLVVFLVTIAIVGFAVWRAWRRVHKAVNQFNSQFGTGTQQEAPRQQRTTTTDSGETIIDTRSQEEVNQKIFSKDEGEYVDYEVKE